VTRGLRRQQGCLGKAAAGCRSPYDQAGLGWLQRLNASREYAPFPTEPIFCPHSASVTYTLRRK
jgi:hypothetical protein